MYRKHERFKCSFLSPYVLFFLLLSGGGGKKCCPLVSPVFDKANTHRTIFNFSKAQSKRGPKCSHGVSSQCIMWRNANQKPTCFHLKPRHHGPRFLFSSIACISRSSNTYIRAQTQLAKHALSVRPPQDVYSWGQPDRDLAFWQVYSRRRETQANPKKI